MNNKLSVIPACLSVACPLRSRRAGRGYRLSGKSKYQEAFTLLEVLIALAIIGLTLTVLIHSQVLSIRQEMKSKYHTTALFLANEILSDTFIQKESLREIETGDFEDEPGFSWEREVENSDIEGLDTIKITVSGPENTQIILNSYRLQQNVMQTRTRR